jgi:prepilin-type N-terminal cleavage/methylation domain-containing protein
VSRGFTLAEIVVVLALLGIIAGVALPAFARLDASDDATRAAEEVLRVLQGARQAALERAAATAVLVEPASGRYWVTFGDSAAGTVTGTFTPPAGVTLVGPEPRARVLFLPTGTAVADSLFLRGPTRTAVVAVDRWTGDVEITIR